MRTIESLRSSPKPGTNTWTPAYWISSGLDQTQQVKFYTEKDIGWSNIANPSKITPDGADPSCGAHDALTFNKCFVHTTERPIASNITSDLREPFINILNRGATTPPMNGTRAPVCQNCGEDGKGGDEDCNGKIQLVNPDHNGKVAALAHGSFGEMAEWRAQWGCSTDHFGKLNRELFSSRIGKLNYLLHNCGMNEYTKEMCQKIDNDKNVTFVDKSQCTSTDKVVCLMTEKAFKDAGVPYPSPDSANGGVVLSWGHGVENGACGSVAYLRQGNGTKHANNTTMNFQIGTRSWSGEWSDSLSGPQIYLTQGLPGEDDSSTCLQPLMMPVPEEDTCDYKYNDKSPKPICQVDKLLEKACQGNCPAVTKPPTTSTCPWNSYNCTADDCRSCDEKTHTVINDGNILFCDNTKSITL